MKIIPHPIAGAVAGKYPRYPQWNTPHACAEQVDCTIVVKVSTDSQRSSSQQRLILLSGETEKSENLNPAVVVAAVNITNSVASATGLQQGD